MYQAHFATPRPSASPRTIMLLMANALDCDVLTLWLERRLGWSAVECCISFSAAMDRCRTIRPCLLALDPAVAPDAMERGTTALRMDLFDHLLVLDSRPSEVRLSEILQESKASYLTRTASPDAFAAAMVSILQNNVRAFDPSLAHRVRHSKKGYRLEDLKEGSLLVLLSPRELQVMKILAAGKSVPNTAIELGLSRSTVDNHKWRIMKKLAVHKSSELTIRAIQEGLIHL